MLFGRALQPEGAASAPGGTSGGMPLRHLLLEYTERRSTVPHTTVTALQAAGYPLAVPSGESSDDSGATAAAAAAAAFATAAVTQ